MLGIDEPVTNENRKDIVAKPILLGEAGVTYDDKTKGKFKVFVTDTIHDWYEMYKNGPNSCMRFGGIGFDFPKQFDWMKEYKLHPMAQLAYNPYIRGFYIKNEKDVTVMRAVIFSDKPQDKENFNFDDYKWITSRWYASDTRDGDYVINLWTKENKAAHQIAKEFGVDLKLDKREWKGFTVKYEYSFEPFQIVFTDKVNKLLIVPYFDNHTRSFTLRPTKKLDKIKMTVAHTIDENDNVNLRTIIAQYARSKTTPYLWAFNIEQVPKIVGGYAT